MRVLQVQSRSRVRGGADDAMDNEAAWLTAAGHVVSQWHYRAAGDASHQIEGAHAVWNRDASAQLRHEISRCGSEVVHVHSAYPLASPAIFRAAVKAGCATVTTLHSYRFSCIASTCLRDGSICELCIGHTVKLAGVRHRCYHDSRAASLAMTASLALHHAAGTFSRYVDRYVALTEFSRDLLVRDGFDPSRVVVAPNGVPDPGEPAERVGPFSYALYLGRLVPEKGVDTMLRAWAHLDGIPLKIAGDGEQRHQVEAAARTLPSVEYVGFLEASELQRLLAGADLLVVPSRWYEGQPLAIVQAMASGVPVICSDVANIAQTVVPSGAGRTWSTGSVADLARVVREEVTDLKGLRRRGPSGRARYLEQHTPHAAVTRLLDTYGQALDSRSTTRLS